MKFVLTQSILLEALQAVVGVVDNNKTIPLLSTILFSAEGNILSLTGTDLEVQITSTIPFDNTSSQPFSFTLPGKKIFEICKSIPSDGEIHFKGEKNKMNIRYGKNCKFNLATLPCDEYPLMERSEAITSFRITQGAILGLLKRTYFAMANHDVRFYLNGMLLELSTDKINAIATDGHRLALNTIAANIAIDHRIQVIVPRKAVSELIRLLETGDSPLDIEVSNTYIKLTTDSVSFSTKLIEGRFPDYQRVIPKGNDKEIVLDRKQLESVLTRSAILCNEKFHGVKFDFEDDQFCISSNNPDHETVEEKLSINYPFEPLSIGFNVSYLIENIRILEEPNVKLKLSNADKSMLIEEVDSSHTSVFVIMPMRL